MCGFEFPDGSNQLGYNLECISNYAVIRCLKKGRFWVFVDDHNRLRRTDTGQVLDSSGNSNGNVEVGAYSNAGLANVFTVWAPVGITHRF